MGADFSWDKGGEGGFRHVEHVWGCSGYGYPGADTPRALRSVETSTPGEGLSGSEGRSEGEISMERVYGRVPTAATIDWSRYGPHRAPNVSNISIPGQHAWRESLGLGPGRCSVPYGSAALSRRHRRSSSISRQPSRLPQRVGRARRRVNGGTGTPTTGTALSRATCRSVAPVTFGFRAAPRALSSRTGQRRRGRSLCSAMDMNGRGCVCPTLNSPLDSKAACAGPASYLPGCARTWTHDGCRANRSVVSTAPCRRPHARNPNSISRVAQVPALWRRRVCQY